MITTEWPRERLVLLELRKDLYLDMFSKTPVNEIVKRNNTQYILNQLEAAIEYQKQIITLEDHSTFFNNNRRVIELLDDKENECLQKTIDAFHSPRIELDIEIVIVSI